jgi:hypothetical protein
MIFPRERLPNRIRERPIGQNTRHKKTHLKI